MKKVLALTETLAAVFLLLIALLTAGNVLMRDLFSVQIPDWFDGSKLMQGIALFLGLCRCDLLRQPHLCGCRVGKLKASRSTPA